MDDIEGARELRKHLNLIGETGNAGLRCFLTASAWALVHALDRDGLVFGSGACTLARCPTPKKIFPARVDITWCRERRTP